jgi:hypothetical protein
MKQIAFPLLLLVLSASVDDVWAAATPDVWDDEVAAENDEYLPAVPREDPGSAARKLLQPPSLRPTASSSSTSLAGSARPDLGSPAHPSPPLFYLLMSLLC